MRLRPGRRLRAAGAAALLVAGVGISGPVAGVVAQGPEPPPADPLAALGYTVTSGAAPGYVEDRACRSCHRRRYDGYQEVGMALSFFRPDPTRVIEDFSTGGFQRESSLRHYEMLLRDGRYVFRRYELDGAARPINVYEQGVDWILGSGHTSRTYLFRTPDGGLYQLPIAWYSQSGKWGMAPGFDNEGNLGVQRKVRRECLFCHNAYPDVAAGSDAHWQPHVFPEALPEGTGCQRCHGPGAEHARVALDDAAPVEKIVGSIVNPDKLPARLRDDVCYQCHMQPSVALFGARRFDRGDYSFRPGQPLHEYAVTLDVELENDPGQDRFEINHHPYRLQQSRCFRESRDALSCLTCHNPHRRVPVEERAAHYRAACLGCHQAESCGLGRLAPEAKQQLPTTDATDCVSCHMPRRRTRDVVQVVMTDHRISRWPGGPERLAPLRESDPVIVGTDFLDPAVAPPGPEGELYRALSAVRAGAGRDALTYLGKLLAAREGVERVPTLDLAAGLLKAREYQTAVRVLRGLLERTPDDPQALAFLGVARAGLRDHEAAVATLRRSLEGRPDQAEVLFNLGQQLTTLGRDQEALEPLGRAVALRPNLASAWFYLGVVRLRLERTAEAVEALSRSLEIEPSFDRAYLVLAQALVARGDRTEALRYLEHGARAALPPDRVREALAAFQASPSSRD